MAVYGVKCSFQVNEKLCRSTDLGSNENAGSSLWSGALRGYQCMRISAVLADTQEGILGGATTNVSPQRPLAHFEIRGLLTNLTYHPQNSFADWAL